jgi:DNA-binding response OmpR family regulator
MAPKGDRGEERRSEPVSTGRTVLLVEDDDEMRRMVMAALARDGYVVRPARDGIEALDYLDTLHRCGRWRDEDLALIVSDVRLPGCSGLEILDCLRALGSAVPVILITAFGDAETRSRAREFGAELLLDKPFDLDDLRGAARAVARA